MLSCSSTRIPAETHGASWSVLRQAVKEYCAKHHVDQTEGIRVAADRLRAGPVEAQTENSTLMQEERHRYRNELLALASFMRMQQRTFTDPKARGTCAGCLTHVGATAHLNELLYVNSAEQDVDLGRHLEAVCEFFSHAYPVKDQVEIRVDSQRIFAGAKMARTMALIVNEALTNAFKHAFPNGQSGRISVTLHRITDEKICLIIEDDGVGASHPGRTGPVKSRKGTGLKLISSLATSLGGRAEHRVGKDGCRLECTF